jgi:hypothetical protein
MKVTFERTNNGWLVTDHAAENFDGVEKFVCEDNDELCEDMFNVNNGHAESLSRALWEAFQHLYQSKHEGGLQVTYFSQGREKTDG